MILVSTKRGWLCLYLAVVVVSQLSVSKVYVVEGVEQPPQPYVNKAESAQNTQKSTAVALDPVLHLARLYAQNYGNRPYYTGAPHPYDWIPGETEAQDVVARILACESLGKTEDKYGKPLEILDSNGKMSRGPGMFQDTTWAWFSKDSGIKGDPHDGGATVKMMLWAASQGLLFHWSCSYTLGILYKQSMHSGY